MDRPRISRTYPNRSRATTSQNFGKLRGIDEELFPKERGDAEILDLKREREQLWAWGKV